MDNAHNRETSQKRMTPMYSFGQRVTDQEYLAKPIIYSWLSYFHFYLSVSKGSSSLFCHKRCLLYICFYYNMYLWVYLIFEKCFHIWLLRQIFKSLVFTSNATFSYFVLIISPADVCRSNIAITFWWLHLSGENAENTRNEIFLKEPFTLLHQVTTKNNGREL